MNNIILIGMPSAGKTTIGKELSNRLNKIFIDSDEVIEDTFSTKPSEIFKVHGEDRFREIETEILRFICNNNHNSIIATGGGCVTRRRNFNILHKSGTIFWIKRDIKLLNIDGRVLGQKYSKIENLYNSRKKLYEDFSDYIIYNNFSIDKAVDDIIEMYEITSNSTN